MMNSHQHDHEHRPFAEKLKHPFADLRQRLKGDVIPLLLLTTTSRTLYSTSTRSLRSVG